MQSAERGIVGLIQESNSGATVLFLTPIRADGARLPTSVVKIDESGKIEEEVHAGFQSVPPPPQCKKVESDADCVINPAS